MRKFASHESRLGQLEGGEASMILRFANGSTRAATVAKGHRLRLLLDSFERARGEAPATSSDALLNLMRDAEAIQTGDRLFQTVFAACQAEKVTKSATPESPAGRE